MTKFEFYEKIGFFMCDKNSDTWQGKMKKKEQIDAFGAYIGRGLISVCETTMTIKNLVSICFGSEMEAQATLSRHGLINKIGKITPLSML